MFKQKNNKTNDNNKVDGTANAYNSVNQDMINTPTATEFNVNKDVKTINLDDNTPDTTVNNTQPVYKNIEDLINVDDVPDKKSESKDLNELEVTVITTTQVLIGDKVVQTTTSTENKKAKVILK